MPRVLLVNPGKNKPWAAVFAPLHLALLASYLEKHGVEVQIIDELAGQSVEEVFESLSRHPELVSGSGRLELAQPLRFRNKFGMTRISERRNHPLSDVIVAITATTPMIPDAIRVAKLAHEYGFLTVLGGRHPSIMPEEVSQYADIVIVGEGEQALLEVVQGRRDPIIKASYIKNLDDIPPPAWHLIDMGFYLKTADRNPRNQLYIFPPGTRLGSYISVRGCPYACIFCYNMWRGTPVRHHSPERVVKDLQFLIDRYRINGVYFYDDDFFAFKKRAQELCRLLIKEQLGLIWGCVATSNSVDLETLKLAREAGCRQVGFGFESGSQRILNLLKGGRMSVERNAAAVRMCREAGVASFGNYMIGNPTETLEDIQQTFEFMKKHRADGTLAFVTTPYPGTGLWEWCRSRGLLPEEIDWSSLTADHLSIPCCDTIPPETVQKLRDEINLYFNPLRISEVLALVKDRPRWVLSWLLRPRRVFSVLKSVLVGKSKGLAG